MPTTLEATQIFQQSGVLFAPGKAANAGGVATSALEMSQNSMRLSWTFEEVDQKLRQIMVNIFHNTADTAQAIWSRRRLRHGREHRGLYEGRQRHAGARHGLRETHCAERRAV